VVGATIRVGVVQDGRDPLALAIDNPPEQPTHGRKQITAQMCTSQLTPAREHAFNIVNG
jgi:hypothetical protein